MGNRGNESENRRGGCLSVLLVLLTGLIVIWVGYGIWRSPHLDWEGFWEAGAEAARWLWSEAIRLWHDPFAVIGIAVVVGGLIIVLYGIRKLFRGG